MLEIMFSWLSIPRTIGIWIDSIAYGLIDNIYNLIDVLASGTLFEENTILTIMNNTYIVISIFALFRIALILVNAMINPDKLNDKENGIGSVLRNLVIMFVLLIFTPMLFREAYYIQKTVVDNHYISKIFNGKVESSDNPGKTMQRIALQALIHPDTDVHTPGGTVPEIANFQGGKYVPGSECGGDCEEAINDYNANILTGDQDLWSTFTKHIGKTEKVDGETVYVYTYTFLVTFAVGVFITYVLASMAIDIAVRSVELAVLQIISPLFIVTFIDPKSAKSGPFHNWLKTVGKTYASLFIKLGVLELMIMFVSLIPKITLFDDKSGLKFWGTLVVLLAILIFAKKAPKWIGEMIGVDGEDSGIGGLGKKIGSAALVGGALTKAGHAAAGAITGGVSAVHNQLRNRRQGRKDAANKLPNRFGLSKNSRQARKDYYDSAGVSGKGYFRKRHQLAKDRRKEARNDSEYGWNKEALKKGVAQFGASMVGGTIAGGKAGLKAENMKGVFSSATNAANQFGQQVGLKGEGIGTRISNAFDSAYTGVKSAYGTAAEINKRIKDAEDAKSFDSFFTSKSGFKTLNSVSNTPVGSGDFNKAFLGAKGNFDIVEAAIGVKCDPKFKDAKISTDKDGIVTVSNGSYSMLIDGQKKTIVDSAGVSHDYDSIRSKGETVLSNEGRANYENMFAEAQRQAISSVIGNNTQMSALMQQKSNAEQSISYNANEAMKIVAGAGLVVNGEITGTTGPVKLADATMDDLKYAMSEAKKKSPGVYDKPAQELDEKAASYSSAKTIISNIDTQIGYYEASNDKLGNMIQSLREKEKDGVKENETKTLDELLVVAEKTKDKMQKAVDAFNQQKSDEKK